MYCISYYDTCRLRVHVHDHIIYYIILYALIMYVQYHMIILHTVLKIIRSYSTYGMWWYDI